MKQLFAAGQTAEPSIRAASSGVQPDAVRTALGAAAYAPTPDGKRPVRLSLLNSPGVGRVLTHVAPQADGYFAHALLDIPATADAQSTVPLLIRLRESDTSPSTLSVRPGYTRILPVPSIAQALTVPAFPPASSDRPSPEKATAVAPAAVS